MGKMSIGVWHQQLLFLLPFLIFVVALLHQAPQSTHLWGEVA